MAIRAPARGVRTAGRGGGASVPSGRSTAKAGVALLEERLQTIIDGLGGVYSIELAIPSTTRSPPKLLRGGTSRARQATLAEVLAWNIHGTTKMPARNMLQLTPSSRGALLDSVVERYYQRAKDDDVPTLAQLMPGVAYAWRDLVVKRYEAGGADLSLRRLTALYRARKLRLGYPARIGTMTGQTIAAVRKAQPIIRKKR